MFGLSIYNLGLFIEYKNIYNPFSKEVKQLDLPAPRLLWPHMKNILWYYNKIIDKIFDLQGYAIYWITACREKNIKRKNYLRFFPAIQMSPLLETAGQC